MHRTIRILTIVSLLWAWSIGTLSSAEVSVIVESQNFLLTAPNSQLADKVLHNAEKVRTEVANQWLGESLPPSVGRTMIRVKLSEREEPAVSLIAEREENLVHSVWLTTTEQKLENALTRELVRVVLATRYPGKLPAWVPVGISGTYADDAQKSVRTSVLRWFAKTDNWPALERVLAAGSISRQDQATDAVAVSLAEFFLTRGDRSRFLEFALTGNQQGWDLALQKYYGIESVVQLQMDWKEWASKDRNEMNRITRQSSKPAGVQLSNVERIPE